MTRSAPTRSALLHAFHVDTMTRLPYGFATTREGYEVLFNRHYRALWRRRPGGAAEVAVDPTLTNGYDIRWWVYAEPHEHPHESEDVFNRCLATLAEWGVKAPTFTAYPRPWRRHRHLRDLQAASTPT